jgi:spore coat polysaccharide biosynthesis protein SpsF (cytidylyltransferase family)
MRPATDLHCWCPARISGELPVSRAELLVAVERIACIWRQRAESEAEIWDSFRKKVEHTEDCDELLEVYSDFSQQRMQAATEDLRRLFEEYRDVVTRFPAAKPRRLPNGLFS